MNLWFTSDTHFSHASIITFCQRPFLGVTEMDETLITRWNQVVKPSDHVYHLGDVAMVRPKRIRHILERLQGHKRLVRGNHDVYRTAEYWEFFEEIHGVRVMDNLLFTHIPVHPASLGRFRANVHGHIHNNQGGSFLPVRRVDHVTQTVRWCPYVNVSVEVTDYRPLSFDEVRARVTKAAQEPTAELTRDSTPCI